MSALADYYRAMSDNLGSEARYRDGAQTQQTNTATGQVADDAASKRAVETAQAGSINTNAALAGPLAQSEIGARGAATQVDAARVGQIGSDIATQGLARSISFDQNYGTNGNAVATALARGFLPDGTGNKLTDPNGVALQYHAKGVAKVEIGKSGKAKGMTFTPKGTDTVPTMLSPGEAVLNRGAQEHLGSGVIHHLNKLGMLRMAAQDEVKQHAATIKGHSVRGSETASKPATKKKAS